MPYLIQKNPNGSPIKQSDLQGKPLTVGRGTEADAHIEDTEMSCWHFVLSLKDGAYVIKDLRSTNGRGSTTRLPLGCH